MDDMENESDSFADDGSVASFIDMTSLKTAIRTLDINGVSEFVRSGCDLQSNFIEPRKYRTALHYLMTSYCSTDPIKRTPHTLGQFTEIIAILTENGLDILDNDVNGQCALHLAASYAGSCDVIQVLLDLGSKVNKIDRSLQSALHKAACSAGRYECLTLVEAGANVNLMDCRGYTALHIAAKRKKCPDVIEQLLECGATVNLQDRHQNKFGPTALHVACRYGNHFNVKCLLKHTAKLEPEEGSGQRCLHLAAAHDNTGKITETLLKAGASPNVKDELFGETPLHKAVSRQMNENILVLLKHGASTNTQDASLETVLHKAAVCCTDISTWSAIFKAKAHSKVTNKDGHTPKDKALRVKNTIGLCMLRQYEETWITDAKSPRLTPRSLHAASPVIMRRNVSA